LGYLGYDFTWYNYHEEGIVVEERLDWYCASMEWSLLFLDAKVTNVDYDVSDHLPVLLQCKLTKRKRGGYGTMFRFEYMWVTNFSYQKVISCAWNSATGANSIDKLITKVDLYAHELSC